MHLNTSVGNNLESQSEAGRQSHLLDHSDAFAESGGSCYHCRE